MKLLSNTAALRIIDSVAIALGQALQLARVRVASLPSPVLGMMAERDHAHGESELLRRELEVFRAQREALKPHRRPDYPPEQRLAILQIMRLRGWNAVVTAKRFVLHPNTVRAWVQTVEGRRDPGRLLGDVPWNRIHDGVRWAVHELRRLCPEPEMGTRTIAKHLVRSGIQVCRTTIQRVLREEKPPRPKRPRPGLVEAVGVPPHHLLAPASLNEVWHLDLAELRILWFRYTIAALLDGYSRKLLALKVYPGTPTSNDIIGLMQRTAMRFGSPRFLITDHGCQFRKRFRKAMKDLGIRVLRGRVRCPAFNGKAERLFRTFRGWQRRTLLPLGLTGIQRKLDAFVYWYNTERPHQGLKGLTPEEAWSGETQKDAFLFRSNATPPYVQVTRRSCRGDPSLPSIRVHIAA
jgi:putative transposase